MSKHFDPKFSPDHKRAFIAAVLDNATGAKCSTKRAITIAPKGEIPGWPEGLTIGQGTAYDWINAEKERRGHIEAGRRARKNPGDSVKDMLTRLTVLHEAELRDLERDAEKTKTFDHNRARDLLRNLKLIDDLATGNTKAQGNSNTPQTPPTATSTTLDKARAAMDAQDASPSEDPTPPHHTTHADETPQPDTPPRDDTHHHNQTQHDADAVRSHVPSRAGGSGDLGARRLDMADSGVLASSVLR